jgi:formylglycine-generating enzyme required for sulfatase activity
VGSRNGFLFYCNNYFVKGGGDERRISKVKSRFIKKRRNDKMAILRVVPRLNVAKQVQLNQVRAKEIHPLRRSGLAISIMNTDGKKFRAADVFVDGRLSLQSDVLRLEEGIIVEIRTLAGHRVKIEKLDGMTPEEIDVNLARVDKLMEKVANRAAEIDIPEMIQIPAGKFTMGSTEYKDEQPVREVTISKSFDLGKYEVTNDEYLVYLQATRQEIPALVNNPDKARHPVVNVSWYDAIKYCNWLSEVNGKEAVYEIKDNGEVIWHTDKKGYRLPTEAEREYAARGTDGRKYPWGNEWDASKAVFNTNGTRQVDGLDEVESPFGAKDLSGNVWEWVWDRYSDYDSNDLTDPQGAKQSNSRVLRGGSWYSSNSDNLRGANRNNCYPDNRYNFIGFRVVQDI